MQPPSVVVGKRTLPKDDACVTTKPATAGKYAGSLLGALIHAARARGVPPPECLSDNDTPMVKVYSRGQVASAADAPAVRITAVNGTAITSDLEPMEEDEDERAKTRARLGNEYDEFTLTDDDEPSYMRRSLSCPIKMQKSASDTRLSIRGRPEFDDVEEVACEAAAAVGDAPACVQLPPVQHNASIINFAMPASLSMTRSESMPVQQSLDEMAAAAARRDRPSGGLFARLRERGLNIPHSVKEDLPSPSTDLSQRLSFTDVPLDEPSARTLNTASNPFFAGTTATSASRGHSAVGVCSTLCGTRVLPLCGFSVSVSVNRPVLLTKVTVGRRRTHTCRRGTHTLVRRRHSRRTAAAGRA
jgi:hypothetical protein